MTMCVCVCVCVVLSSVRFSGGIEGIMYVCVSVCVQLRPAVLSSVRFSGGIEGLMFNGKIIGPWNFAEARYIDGFNERYMPL